MMAQPELDLVVLDIDGTVLDTPHLRAWQEAIGTLWPSYAGAIDTHAYQHHIAGRPRALGAAAALKLVGRSAHREEVAQLATAKQGIFEDLARSCKLYSDARTFLLESLSHQVEIAFCTASRNAGRLLETALACDSELCVLLPVLHRSLGSDLVRLECGRAEACDAVRRVFGARPDRCVVIDDVPYGVHAAQSVGMQGVWLDRIGLAPISVDGMGLVRMPNLEAVGTYLGGAWLGTK